MEYILVVASVYNLIGALTMWFQKVPNLDAENKLSAEYMQYRIFTGGTAFLFSAVYLYVYYVPAQALPLLLFGIGLKCWSFLSCYISHKRYGFPKSEFLKIGVGNLVFALLFSVYLLSKGV